MTDSLPVNGVSPEERVPRSVMNPGALPPLLWHDLPAPVPFRRMIGPSLILAGLALGSGEFIIWPHITYKSQFIFFWACVVGVLTQYFLNMEITRWTLATGESSITGFLRLGRAWAGPLLGLTLIPWIFPAWATGAAELLSWLLWEPDLVLNEATGLYTATAERYVTPLAIGGMVLCGLLLTAGPVLYETMEKIQLLLIAIVAVLILVLAAMIIRPEAFARQFVAGVTFGWPEVVPPAASGLDAMMLLGALAFAGAGGTLNLGQSNYVKDKGYGMGQLIGRITSPITGQQEAVAELGYLFRPTEENERRWRIWWWNASWEHFLSFLVTCVVCLSLLTLIAYCIFYDSNGTLRDGAERYGGNMDFILGEAHRIDDTLGPAMKTVFLLMGVAILLTTEFGVLDCASRVSTDLVKVAWLRESTYWSESRLYFVFLWGLIVCGSAVLVLRSLGWDLNAFTLFKLTAAMNGGVMFLYSAALLYLNRVRLPSPARMTGWRVAAMVWSVLFFGFFSVWAAYDVIAKQFIG